MDSYKIAYQILQEETGCLWVQIHPKNLLTQKVELIDKMRNHYLLPLKDYTFILQKKAKPIYETLERYISSGSIDKAKEAITHILTLFLKTCQKGYINCDALLTHNIGLLETCAIHIDIGDFTEAKGIEEQEQTVAYTAEITHPLRKWLSTRSPILLQHFDQELKRLVF